MKKAGILGSLALALFLRIGYTLYLAHFKIMTPWSHNSDPYGYNNLAISLLKHGVYGYDGRPSAFRPPLYSLCLAALYSLFGVDNFLAVRIFQALLSTGTVFLLYLIGKEIYSERAGIIAALIGACYPFFAYFAGEVLSETLFIFLLNLSVYSLVRLPKSPHLYGYLLSGIIISLTSLCRPMVSVIPIAVLWVLAVSKREKLFTKTFLFILGILMFVTPWSIRNYKQFHSFVPFSSNGWFTLALGATTLPYDDAMVKLKGAVGYDFYDLEDPKNRDFNEVEWDKQSHDFAIAHIRSNPWGYAKYVMGNFVKFFIDLDFSSTKDRKAGGLLSLATGLVYIGLLSSALLGAIVSFRKGFTAGPLLLLMLIASSALFYSLNVVGKRYRIAMVDSALIIFGSFLYSIILAWLGSLADKRRMKKSGEISTLHYQQDR